MKPLREFFLRATLYFYEVSKKYDFFWIFLFGSLMRVKWRGYAEKPVIHSFGL